MAVFFVCLLAGWETVSRIAGVLFLALAIAFAVRLVHRKLHGASWDQAWGAHTPAESSNRTVRETADAFHALSESITNVSSCIERVSVATGGVVTRRPAGIGGDGFKSASAHVLRPIGRHTFAQHRTLSPR